MLPIWAPDYITEYVLLYKAWVLTIGVAAIPTDCKESIYTYFKS